MTSDMRDAALSEWQRGVDVTITGDRGGFDVYLANEDAPSRRSDHRDGPADETSKDVLNDGDGDDIAMMSLNANDNDDDEGDGDDVSAYGGKDYRVYRFERGGACVTTIEAESIGRVKEVRIAPVAGTWMPEAVELESTRGEWKERMECAEKLDADDVRMSYAVLRPGQRPELAPISEQRARGGASASASASGGGGLREYDALKRRVVASAAGIAAALGATAAALATVTEPARASAVAVGAAAGLLYVLLLGAGADDMARPRGRVENGDTNPPAAAAAAAVQSVLAAPPLRLSIVAVALAFAVESTSDGAKSEPLLRLGAAAMSLALTSRGALALALTTLPKETDTRNVDDTGE